MGYSRQNFKDGKVLTAENLINIENAIVSKWYGKTINVLGDSITYGVGLSSSSNNFTNVLASMTGATVNNYGISGTKISGNDTNSFCNRFPNMCNGADLIIIFGGTNDYWHKGTTIGETNSKDKTTFSGAINTIIDYHCNNNGTKTKLLFVFPFNQYYGSTSCDNDFGYGNFKQFRNAMREICDNRGMCFLDLYSESGMDIAHNETHKSTFSTDGVHAKDAGHKVIAEKIFNKIEYGM